MLMLSIGLHGWRLLHTVSAKHQVRHRRQHVNRKRRRNIWNPTLCLLIVLGLQSTLVESADQLKLYTDSEYRFSLGYPGDLVPCVDARVCIRFPSRESAAKKGTIVRIFVDKQPLVFLSGTFGGKYYFRETASPSEVTNRVLTDELVVNDIFFRREYWIVYAGRGAWDTVINCYTEYNMNYYIISLDGHFISGIPGTEIGGRRIGREELINRALGEMLNNQTEDVNMLNQILSSFILER